MTKPTGRRSAMAAVGVAALAVVCCAGLPLVIGLFGGLTLAGVLGVGTGFLAAAAVVAVAFVFARARRRRACAERDLVGTPTPGKP